MRNASITDELRRQINMLYVTVDDELVRVYLDAAFVALEEEPTHNADLSPASGRRLVDFDSPVALLDELRPHYDNVESLVRCRHALRSAEALWHLHEGARAG
jgi:hypothetical protein